MGPYDLSDNCIKRKPQTQMGTPLNWHLSLVCQWDVRVKWTLRYHLCWSSSGDVSLMTWRQIGRPASSAQSFLACPLTPCLSSFIHHSIFSATLASLPSKHGWQRLIDQLAELLSVNIFKECCHEDKKPRQKLSSGTIKPGANLDVNCNIFTRIKSCRKPLGSTEGSAPFGMMLGSRIQRLWQLVKNKG